MDFVMLNGLLWAFYLWNPYMNTWTIDRVELFWLVCNLAMALIQMKFSTNIHLRLISGGEILRRGFYLTVMQTIVAYLIMKMIDIMLPVGWVLISLGCYQFIVLISRRLIERNLIKLFRMAGMNMRTVTLVGSDPELIVLYKKLVENPTFGFRVKGYYANEDIRSTDNEEGGRATKTKIEITKLGTINKLVAEINRGETPELGEELYVCLPRREREILWKLSSYCDMNMVRFYYVPPSVERLGMKLNREFIEEMEVFSTYDIPLENYVNKAEKRIFDIILSVLVLMVVMLILPIVALVILLQSPGPIFFRQERTGVNGRNFICYKFRSMHVNKDADTLQATEHDPRKFPFGDFMRKYNIDELPQFWNVLKGDMSVVGPRPHMLMHTEYYSNKLARYMVRHFVKPGITGWAQVTGFRGETKELWQMDERLKRDIWYIENWSIWLDLRIIWMTIKGFFRHDEKAY